MRIALARRDHRLPTGVPMWDNGGTNEQCPEPALTGPGLPHPFRYNEGGEAIMADLKRTATPPPGGGI